MPQGRAAERTSKLLPDTRVTHGDPLVGGVSFSNTPGQCSVLYYPVVFENRAGITSGCGCAAPVRKTTACMWASTANGPTSGARLAVHRQAWPMAVGLASTDQPGPHRRVRADLARRREARPAHDHVLDARGRVRVRQMDDDPGEEPHAKQDRRTWPCHEPDNPAVVDSGFYLREFGCSRPASSGTSCEWRGGFWIPPNRVAETSAILARRVILTISDSAGGSIVGEHVRLWRSKDLIEWEYLGEPFSLDDTFHVTSTSAARIPPTPRRAR